VTDKTDILKRLKRANSEQISHEVIGTDPIQVRIENDTPASRSDKTTHLVVVGDDWITSSSPDHLYRDTIDKYMLYLATQDDDLLLRDRVRSVIDVDLGGSEPGRTRKGLSIADGAQDSGETDNEQDHFQDFVNNLVD
jgi:hypothetical protein